MTTLVTGATGKVGRQVAAELSGRGISIRAGSRRSAVPLDWDDPATWPAALDGVDRVFVVVPGGDDGHRSVVGLGAQVCRFLDLAASSGVSHVVLMTALGMDFAPAEVEQRAVELHLQATGGLTWTILRPNWFFQNVTEGPLRSLADAAGGVLRLPTQEAAVSFIDTCDVAAVAAEALVGGHAGCEYALTGPESLTLSDVAGLCRLSAVPIRGYEAVSDDEFRHTALGLGWHHDYVDTLSSLFATIATGATAEVHDDTRHVLGRSPRTLRAFLAGVGAPGDRSDHR